VAVILRSSSIAKASIVMQLVFNYSVKCFLLTSLGHLPIIDQARLKKRNVIRRHWAKEVDIREEMSHIQT
jgi:hypothetical protein